MDRAFGSSAVYEETRDSMNEELGDSHLVAIHEVVQAIARQTDCREVLPLIAAKARTLTSSESTAIVLLDPSRSCLDFAAVSGVDAADMVGQRVLVDDALLGHTALTGEIYVADNLTARPLLPSLDSDNTLTYGVRSAAVVPIYLSGASVGAFAALNRTNNESFNGVDVLRLQMMASVAAIALGNEKLRIAAQQQERERNILLEAARAASSSLNVQEVLQSILSTIGASMEMNAGAVFLINDERTRLYIAADVGLNEDDTDRQLEADDGWAAQVLASGTPLCVVDVEQGLSAARSVTSSSLSSLYDGDLPIPGVRSLLAAPLISRSAAEGMIVVGSRLPGVYTTHDAEMLAAVASHAATSLENAWLFEDASRRAQEATAIYELSQSVGATLKLDRVLDFVADSVLTLLHVDKVALFLHNERNHRLEVKVARNLSEDGIPSIQPKVGEGIAGWVMEFETPTAVQDVSADHRNKSCPIDQEGVVSLVSVPIAVAERVVGVLHAMSSRRRLFTVGEMELLYTIANQVGASIVNAQSYAEQRQKKEELRKSVRRVARALGSLTDFGKGAQIIADLAVDLVEADRSIVYTLSAGNRITPRAASNFKPGAASIGAPLPRTPNSAAAWVAKRGRSLMVDNIEKDSRYVWPDYAVRDRNSSYLGVPLKFGKDTVGVLEVYSREPRRFTADEVRSLLTFASQASVGLKNALLIEQAERRKNELNVLGELSGRLFTADNVEELCREALTRICAASSSDIGLFRTYVGGDLKIGYQGPNAVSDDVQHESIAVESALSHLVDWVREYGEMAQIPSANGPAGEISAIAVPVRKGDGGTIGSIALARVLPGNEFDDDDRRFLETVANLFAARLG